jgi:hypothetical protein
MKRCKKIVMNAGFELGMVPASKNKVVNEKRIVGKSKPQIKLD